MTERRKQRRASAALLLAAGVLLFAGLGQVDLWAPDEPRYAQISEELRSMRHGASGLILLHSGGEPYTQKPPLYYWLAAAFGSPLGEVSEVAARLPSALAGFACVAVTLLFGRRLLSDPSASLWAGAVLLTVFRFAHLARRAQLDVLLTLLELCALFAFWRLESKQGSPRANLLALQLALALALLVKGPVAALPLAVMAIYLWWEGRSSQTRQLLGGWTTALAVGPLLAWFAAALALAPPGFFGEAVTENLIGRFFSGTSHARPFYYFVYQLPVDFMPWTLLWPLAAIAAARQLRSAGDCEARPHDRRAIRLLLVWIGVYVVFFSLSAGKRGLYLLPIFPAAALLCGHALAERFRMEGLGAATSRMLFNMISLIASALFAAGVWIALSGGVPLPGAPGFRLSAGFGVALVASSAGWALCECWLRPLRASSIRRMVAAIVALLCVELSVFMLAYPGFDAQKSPRHIAEAALQYADPGAPIGVFDEGALLGGIAYYSGRRVVRLETPEQAKAFLSNCRGPVVVKSHKLDRLSPSESLQVRALLRSGRRQIAIVTARRPES